MPNLEKKSFATPDREMRRPNTHGALVDLDGMTVGRYTYGPGWRWIDVIGPLVGSDMCHIEHYGFALNGHLKVVHEDGSQTEVGPGDVYRIAPRHQGEVVGGEPFETIEFLPHQNQAERTSAIG